MQFPDQKSIFNIPIFTVNFNVARTLVVDYTQPQFHLYSAQSK